MARVLGEDGVEDGAFGIVVEFDEAGEGEVEEED